MDMETCICDERTTFHTIVDTQATVTVSLRLIFHMNFFDVHRPTFKLWGYFGEQNIHFRIHTFSTSVKQLLQKSSQ